MKVIFSLTYRCLWVHIFSHQGYKWPLAFYTAHRLLTLTPLTLPWLYHLWNSFNFSQTSPVLMIKYTHNCFQNKKFTSSLNDIETKTLVSSTNKPVAFSYPCFLPLSFCHSSSKLHDHPDTIWSQPLSNHVWKSITLILLLYTAG